MERITVTAKNTNYNFWNRQGITQ